MCLLVNIDSLLFLLVGFPAACVNLGVTNDFSGASLSLIRGSAEVNDDCHVLLMIQESYHSYVGLFNGVCGGSGSK